MVVVFSGASEAWEIGSRTALASRIQATEADHQMAQRGHVLRSVSGANRRLIFAEGDVADVVDRIFNRPMSPAETLEPRGVQLGGGATGQDDFGFFSDANFFKVMSGANNDSGLNSVGETGAFWRDLERINLAGFMPTMALVQSDVRRGKKRLPAPRRAGRVSEIT